MAQGEPFEIDIADPNAIADAIPQVEANLAAAKADLKEARDRAGYWEAVLARLNLINGASEPPKRRKSPRNTLRERILGIVNDADHPLTTDDVLSQLPPDTPRKTVGWSLWDLERAQKIQRVSQGLYASLDYEVTPSLTPHLLQYEADGGELRLVTPQASGE